jgi:hypothetical protein
MKKKKTESIKRFINRRNKETGKVVIPETKPEADMAAGSHRLKANHMQIGVVKKKTAKKLERFEKKRKRKGLYDTFN